MPFECPTKKIPDGDDLYIAITTTDQADSILPNLSGAWVDVTQIQSGDNAAQVAFDGYHAQLQIVDYNDGHVMEHADVTDQSYADYINTGSVMLQIVGTYEAPAIPLY